MSINSTALEEGQKKMKVNLSYNVLIGELTVREYGRKGRINNEVILKDLKIAGDVAGKSKASEYIAGLRLIGQSIKRGLKALRDWRPFIDKNLDADRAERRERERLERIRERELRDERRARKNPKGWRHVRA